MTTLTAAVTESQGAPFTLEEVELVDLRPDEVLVRVAAAGICHTDLIVRDQWYPVPLPAVLGHEGAGVVERVGRAVCGVKPGDRVAMSFHSCGGCGSCLTGRPAYCRDFFGRNFGASRPDGSTALSRGGAPLHAHFFGQSSFATLSVANARNVVPLDCSIRLDLAAAFGCGIQTGAGAVLNVLRPQPGSSIVVFGTGTVGLAAVMAASAAGCTTIIGVDRLSSRLAMAREFGATHVVDAREVDAEAAIERIAPGGVAYSLETTASPAVLRQAVESLAPMGVCGLIGAAAFGTEVSLDMNSILVAGRSIRGIVEGDCVPQEFIPRLLHLWELGRFPVGELMRFYDFDQIEQAARDAEAGVVVKPVLRMSG
jgi:aryl-alcohol dehydrogenase